MTVDRRLYSMRSVFALLLLGGMASTAAAQGGVRGVIRDNGGEGIPGARIIAESLETSQTRTTMTNNSGRFAFIGLAGGDWLFVVQADGFREQQGYSAVRRSGEPARVEFSLDPDPFNPVAPGVGVLAGVKSVDILARLRGAERLFDGGDYDGAIDAYQDLLEMAPALTSVNCPSATPGGRSGSRSGHSPPTAARWPRIPRIGKRWPPSTRSTTGNRSLRRRGNARPRRLVPWIVPAVAGAARRRVRSFRCAR